VMVGNLKQRGVKVQRWFLIALCITEECSNCFL
jgi:hypothetical protein